MLDDMEKNQTVELTQELIELLYKEPAPGFEICFDIDKGWLVTGKENRNRVIQILKELRELLL